MSQSVKDRRRGNAAQAKPEPGGSSRRRRQEAARRRQRRQRAVSFGLPVLIVLSMVVVGLVVSGGHGSRRGLPNGRVIAGGLPMTQALSPGAAIPGFSAPGLFGGRVAWSDATGSPAVVVAWAPWCPHCQKELPVMARMATEFPSVRLITVVTDVAAHPGPTAQEFMTQHGLSFPVAVDDGAGSIGRALGIQGFPTIYYVDRSGRVKSVSVGEEPESKIRAAFAALAGPTSGTA